jgi:hypothetical protein
MRAESSQTTSSAQSAAMPGAFFAFIACRYDRKKSPRPSVPGPASEEGSDRSLGSVAGKTVTPLLDSADAGRNRDAFGVPP